jgi:dihydrofolate reductase
MTKPKISIVVAITEKDRGIGHGQELLFRISDDLKRFKALTTGHPIIMGRKTFESIGRPLPGRTTIVITRNREWNSPGVVVAASIHDAINAAHKAPGSDHIFIIGGGEIYKQALNEDLVDVLELTIVKAMPEKQATVFFPPYEGVFTKETFREDRIDATTGAPYTWLRLEK